MLRSTKPVLGKEFVTLLLPIPKEGPGLLVSLVPLRDDHGVVVLTYRFLLVAVVENVRCAARQDTTSPPALSTLLTGSQKSDCKPYPFFSENFALRGFNI